MCSYTTITRASKVAIKVGAEEYLYRFYHYTVNGSRGGFEDSGLDPPIGLAIYRSLMENASRRADVVGIGLLFILLSQLPERNVRERRD